MQAQEGEHTTLWVHSGYSEDAGTVYRNEREIVVAVHDCCDMGWKLLCGEFRKHILFSDDTAEEYWRFYQFCDLKG